MHFSPLIASLFLFVSSTQAASPLQTLLESSHIIDLTTIDINTNTTLNIWRQYQSVMTVDLLKTTIRTESMLVQPYNQTILYEQALLSGIGGSAMDGPIYEYEAISYAQTFSGINKTWISCDMTSISTRQPNYCTEIITNEMNMIRSCGLNHNQSCVMSSIACRHNNIILPTIYYLLDSITGIIISSMSSINSTQITYWSNIIKTPTVGQFGDNILLPASTSCPNQNTKFPAKYGNAPIVPVTNTTNTTSSSSSSSSASASSAASSSSSSSSSASSSSTGAVGSSSASSTGGAAPSTSSSSSSSSSLRSSSSTGPIQTGAASSSIPALSTILMLLPAVMTAFLRV